MKRTIIIAFIIMMLATLALSCTGSRLAELEAIVEQTQALDAEFEMVISAYLEALDDETSWLYQDNTPKSVRFPKPWSRLNGFDFLIDDLDTLADYRLETSGHLIQLLPGTDIERLAWEGR